MSSNGKSELTLALDGEVTARDLAESAAAFARLLDVLVQTEAPGVALEWVITDLRPGSSSTTADCRPLEPIGRTWVPMVIAGGQRFAEAMEREDATLAPPLREIADQLRSLVTTRGRLIRVRFESPDKDYILVGPRLVTQPLYKFKRAAFGSMRGRVQAMSNHRSLRFTLYDINDGRGISCYLADGEEDKMMGTWDKLVEVEGDILRDPESGRALTIRNIADITFIREGIGWRRGLGALPGFLGGESSEDVTRRARSE